MMMDAQQKLIDSIGINIHQEYMTIGRHHIHFIVAGSGPPLLLLHGANIGWGAWAPNLKNLAKHFTVYAIDLPGSGHSSSLHFRTSNLEKDFVETVEKFIHLKKIDRPTIIGHSLGGWIALKLGIQGIPINRMILQSPLGLADYIPWSFKILSFYPFAQFLAKTVMKPTKKNMKKFLTGVMDKSSILPEELLEYFHENVRSIKMAHPFLLLNRLFGTFKLREEIVLSKKISKISCPTMIIAGEKDPLIPPALIKKQLHLFSNIILEIFPSTGHIPSLEKSEEFDKMALYFFSKNA